MPADRTAVARVLIVEDDPLVALDLVQTVEEAGYAALGPTGTIDSALRLIDLEKPDAAVLDLSLGGRIATPVAQSLKDAGVPFVLATGNDWLLDQPPFLGEPYEGVPNLGKPTALPELVSLLAQLLRETALRRIRAL